RRCPTELHADGVERQQQAEDDTNLDDAHRSVIVQERARHEAFPSCGDTATLDAAVVRSSISRARRLSHTVNEVCALGRPIAQFTCCLPGKAKAWEGPQDSARRAGRCFQMPCTARLTASYRHREREQSAD